MPVLYLPFLRVSVPLAFTGRGWFAVPAGLVQGRGSMSWFTAVYGKYHSQVRMTNRAL